MNPRLILAVILGGMTGVFTLTILGGGLVSPASPGSILAVLAMTPKGAYFANIAGVCAAMAVSFVVSAILLKTSKVKEEDDIEAATRRMQDMKAESKGASPLSAGDVTNDLSHVRKSSLPVTPVWVPVQWAQACCVRNSGCRSVADFGH
ncbi:PTS system subunit IIABC [Escherichia coli]|uniref:PTS system subunit IIABC n=1 Tax=Escherichia coli TaxID=562 RepID=A0A447X6D7_ECOLX|nr:PTS system subunit IIABC [Escherichia coli]